MKIIPSGPAFQNQTGPSQSAQDARARAISMLTGAAPQVDQTSVSAEEMGAVKPSQTLQDASGEQLQSGQGDTIDAATKDAPEAKQEQPADKQQDQLSKQFAILARKEKQLRAQVAEMKAKEAAIAAREAAMASKDTEYQEKYVPRDRISQDPFSVLTESGLSYEDLTNRLLNQSKPDPFVQSEFERLKGEIKALRDAQENSQKSLKDQQKQQYDQAVKQIRTDVQELVASSQDFETIQETGSVDDVVELIERTFQAEGRVMSVDEAARAVEEYLTEEAIKIAKIKKIQQKLNAASPPAQSQKQPQVEATKQAPLKTLTNSVGSTRRLTARERAILAFKGETQSKG